jgi:transposase
MTDTREKTAIAMLRSGASFMEAAESTNLPVTTVIELWNDTHQPRLLDQQSDPGASHRQPE